ncbi:MAG: MarR family transcriptional regulator [Pseudomonadota bacterium]
MSDHRRDSALIALRQIFRVTEINARSLAKSSGLSASHYIALQVLSDDRNVTQRALADEVSLSQATVTTMLERLTEQGYVRRERCPQDRRKIFVQITDLGRQTLDEAPSLLQERFSQRFDRLVDWEQAFLVAALERTAKLLDAEEIDAAPVLDLGQLNEPGD